MSHYDAESHLREIKAFYLDRILGTGVVPPCVGYRLDRRHVLEDDETWAVVPKLLACTRKNGNENATATATAAGEGRGEETYEGSIMLWTDGLRGVKKGKIAEGARLLPSADYDGGNSTQEDYLLEEHRSATNYAIFHYLAACMKSDHNHFAYGKKGWSHGPSPGVRNLGQRYVAIDNDRCMTPEAIYNNRKVPREHYDRIRLWEGLVFETVCRVQHHRLPVMRVVREAAAGGGGGRLVSSRLVKALGDDALSNELTSSQPEAFAEIDRRINKLNEHIQKNCPPPRLEAT